MSLGSKLIQLRKEKNYSQKEISELIDVSQAVYCKWESDLQKPKLENRLKLSEIYDIDLNELMIDKSSITIVQNQENKDSQVANGYKVRLDSNKAIIKLSSAIEKLTSQISTQNELILKLIQK